jgi:hypothetical protein
MNGTLTVKELYRGKNAVLARCRSLLVRGCARVSRRIQVIGIESLLDVAVKVSAIVGCVLGLANTGWLFWDRRPRLKIDVKSHTEQAHRGAVRATIINPSKNVVVVASVGLMVAEAKGRNWKNSGEVSSASGGTHFPCDLGPGRRLDVTFSAHDTFAANIFGRFYVEAEIESGKCFRSKIVDAKVTS